MILQRLFEFGKTLPGTLPTGYQDVLITLRIELDRDGNLLGVTRPSGSKKGKSEGLIQPVPYKKKSSNVVAQLVADGPDYVLGKANEKLTAAKATERHKAYVERIQECALVTSAVELKAIEHFLKSEDLDNFAAKHQISDDDYLDFQVDDVRPVELPSVQDYWASKLDDSTIGRCLVTGKTGPIVKTMPIGIKGIPDGQTAGAVLSSVNIESGNSFGLSQSLNSPISVGAAEVMCNGLNSLLASDRHSFRIDSCVVVVWVSSNEPSNALDRLMRPNSAHVLSQYKSIGLADGPNKLIDAKGRQVGPRFGKADRRPKINARNFFILILSAYGPRLVIRDYDESSISSVDENLDRWEQLTALQDVAGNLAKKFGIRELAHSLYPRNDKKPPPSVNVSRALIKAAINAHPIPKYLLAMAVNRNRAMQGPFETNEKKETFFAISRLCLIKAILQQEYPMNDLTMLDSSFTHPAYLAGRLLAIFDKIQYHYFKSDGQESPNVSLADKYFGSCSAAPNLILAHIGKLARSHLSKLGHSKKTAAIAIFHERLLSEVYGKFKVPIPDQLTMSEQGLFALGFYHQRISRFTEKEGHSVEQQEDSI
jgi:CRISPR-associated protein Csd1